MRQEQLDLAGVWIQSRYDLERIGLRGLLVTLQLCGSSMLGEVVENLSLAFAFFDVPSFEFPREIRSRKAAYDFLEVIGVVDASTTDSDLVLAIRPSL